MSKFKRKYIETYDFPFCSLVTSKYNFTALIGEGTYGKVYKGVTKDGFNSVVALKQYTRPSYEEGFPMTALREIKILQSLKAENIVQLLEVCRSQSNGNNKWHPTVYLVLEYCEFVLADMVFNRELLFSIGEIKATFKQILDGLSYIHARKVLHRDLKGSNVLVNVRGVVKITDFGLARDTWADCRLTNKVVSHWYKAPELLLGDTSYGAGIDMWSAGCMLAEMVVRHPLFLGQTEQAVLYLISDLCGSITTEVWPGVVKLLMFHKVQLPRNCTRKLNKYLSNFTSDPMARHLVDQILTLDPGKRIDANSALDHEFFWKGSALEPLHGLLHRYKMLTSSPKILVEDFFKINSGPSN